MKQQAIWNKGEELPLFTQTPIKVEEHCFNPQPILKPPTLPGMLPPREFEQMAKNRHKILRRKR